MTRGWCLTLTRRRITNGHKIPRINPDVAASRQSAANCAQIQVAALSRKPLYRNGQGAAAFRILKGQLVASRRAGRTATLFLNSVWDGRLGQLAFECLHCMKREMTSGIGSRPNGSCGKCKCPGNRAPTKPGWSRMGADEPDRSGRLRSPSCPWLCETGAEEGCYRWHGRGKQSVKGFNR